GVRFVGTLQRSEIIHDRAAGLGFEAEAGHQRAFLPGLRIQQPALQPGLGVPEAHQGEIGAGVAADAVHFMASKAACGGHQDSTRGLSRVGQNGGGQEEWEDPDKAKERLRTATAATYCVRTRYVAPPAAGCVRTYPAAAAINCRDT